MGKHLLSASSDMNWFLWDLETQKSLLEQEGHIGAIYGLDIHRDGSLVGSADFTGVCLLWDLRSGKAIETIAKGDNDRSITSLKFAPSGYHLAYAGDSNCVTFIDLRKR